eukprot:COSAG01_NODE_23_length_37704_cov_30.005877_26_plen_49_part_00
MGISVTALVLIMKSRGKVLVDLDLEAMGEGTGGARHLYDALMMRRARH